MHEIETQQKINAEEGILSKSFWLMTVLHL